MKPRQDGCHFTDDIFKCIFFNENVWDLLTISLKLVPEVEINNIPVLVQIMAWRLRGDKPSTEPLMVRLLPHICITRPQSVKENTLGNVICKISTVSSQPQWDKSAIRAITIDWMASGCISNLLGIESLFINLPPRTVRHAKFHCTVSKNEMLGLFWCMCSNKAISQFTHVLSVSSYSDVFSLYRLSLYDPR